jgi:hypothetical protein
LLFLFRFAMNSETLIVTGADAAHFANLRVLIGSWAAHLPSWPLSVCDYGLLADQKRELFHWANLRILPPPAPITHPWQGKSLIGGFLRGEARAWSNLMWIDADAFFASAVPPLGPLMAGYDLLIDAHVQSVGEITQDCNLAPLELRKDDAYFSAGWWVARRGCLLENYAVLCAKVQGQGNLWEGDAFVAAIYREKLKIRTVCGSVWHARGKTSLSTCEVRGLEVLHAGQPIYVVHANAGYAVRPDGRRVLARPELAAVQDHYELFYQERVAELSSGSPNPKAGR